MAIKENIREEFKKIWKDVRLREAALNQIDNVCNHISGITVYCTEGKTPELRIRRSNSNSPLMIIYPSHRVALRCFPNELESFGKRQHIDFNVQKSKDDYLKSEFKFDDVNSILIMKSLEFILDKYK